jgi:hypothetical protein
VKTLYISIQLLSAAFAFAAAVLWLQASRDRASDHLMKEIQNNGGPDFFGTHVTRLVATVVKQSKLNAAAACAAVAAVFQAIAAAVST